jgi:hypothetical protein
MKTIIYMTLAVLGIIGVITIINWCAVAGLLWFILKIFGVNLFDKFWYVFGLLIFLNLLFFKGR